MIIPLLVSCDWLNNKMQSADLGNIVIVDVTSSQSSDKGCFEDFKKCHIPGARYVNIMNTEHTEILVQNIPTAETFTSMVQSVGVNNDTHIIVYSDSRLAGFFMSGRGWWTFKVYGHNNVSILDGGIRKWKQLGYPTTEGGYDDDQSYPGNFIARLFKPLYIRFEEVYRNVKSTEPTFQLVDIRAPSVFTEENIPGAKNLFVANLIDEENGVLKPKNQLIQMFTNSGIDLSKPVTVYCIGGVSASTVLFVAHLLDIEKASIFHGGLVEWKKKTGTCCGDE